MLGEVYLLRRALEEANMEMQKLHPSIKPPGVTSGPIMRVRLAKDGSVVGIEAIAQGEIAGLWTHMDGNHSSFPVLRIREPLLLLPDNHRFSWQPPADGSKAKKVAPADKRRELQGAIAQCSTSIKMENSLELLKRISASKGEMLATATENTNISIVAEVCRAFQTALALPDEQDGSSAFLTELNKQVINFLDTCDESSLQAVELLLFTPAPATSKDKRMPVQIVLDSDDPDSKMYRRATRTAIALTLLDGESGSQPVRGTEQKASTVACAFTGSHHEELYSGSFPKISLPVVATKGALLFTMNSAAPCNERYGQKDTALMPVSRSLVLKLQDALSYIVAPERKDKTWRAIASDKPGQTDLLIVYVDGMPEIDKGVAALFGTDEDQTQRQYNVDVEAVCKALNGIVVERPDSLLHLFIVRKASEGQAFIALIETPTVAEVLAGAHWWQQAGENVPVFTVPVQVQKQTQDWIPQTPSPSQVTQMLTQLWTPVGSSKVRVNKVRGIAFSEILNLMLTPTRQVKAQASARRILQTVLRSETKLLVGIGGCRHGWQGWETYSDDARKVALRATSLIGIALYALGSEKGDYMKEEAYRIGQLLALADRLHRCYCTVERNGSNPPSFIGNSAFDTALDSPERALAVLAARMRIYIGWARSETTGEQSNSTAAAQKPDAKLLARREARREAKSILERYETLAAHFEDNDIPSECTDEMRAKMLLGYLASTEDSHTQNQVQNTHNDSTQTGDPA